MSGRQLAGLKPPSLDRPSSLMCQEYAVAYTGDNALEWQGILVATSRLLLSLVPIILLLRTEILVVKPAIVLPDGEKCSNLG